MKGNQGKKGWKAHASQGWATKPRREEEEWDRWREDRGESMGLIRKESQPTESRTRTAVRRGTGDCLHTAQLHPGQTPSWLHYGQKMLKLQTHVT